VTLFPCGIPPSGLSEVEILLTALLLYVAGFLHDFRHTQAEAALLESEELSRHPTPSEADSK
jgi:hypothetical protein